MARHRATSPRYGFSRLWRAPRPPLNELLWFRGWIFVVALPAALIGVGVSELTAGHLFGPVWLLAAGSIMLIFGIYARRPVVRKTSLRQTDPEPAVRRQ